MENTIKNTILKIAKLLFFFLPRLFACSIPAMDADKKPIMIVPNPANLWILPILFWSSLWWSQGFVWKNLPIIAEVIPESVTQITSTNTITENTFFGLALLIYQPAAAKSLKAQIIITRVMK